MKNVVFHVVSLYGLQGEHFVNPALQQVFRDPERKRAFFRQQFLVQTFFVSGKKPAEKFAFDQKVDLLVVRIGIFETVNVARADKVGVSAGECEDPPVDRMGDLSVRDDEKFPVIVVVQGVEVRICPGEGDVAIAPGGRAQKVCGVHFVVFRHGNIREDRFFKRIHTRIIADDGQNVN